MTKPHLSICIPAYKQAALLEKCLLAVAPQVEALAGRVEVVVSDDCSPDATPEAVERVRKRWPAIRYHRNERNLGFAGNVVKVAGELAQGEFGWIIGQDDIVLPGGVRRVMDVLDAHPEVDYVFANTAAKEEKDREACEAAGYNPELLDFSMTAGGRKTTPQDRSNILWEDLIDPDIDMVFLGALMCSAFRRSVWNQHQLVVNDNSVVFSSVELAYPHAVILAGTMKGRNAYYIGKPVTVAFWGSQEWMSGLAHVVVNRLPDLLDLYERTGVSDWQIRLCRRDLLVRSPKFLREMLFDRWTPGRAQFSVWRFVRKNRGHLRLVLHVCWLAWTEQWRLRVRPVLLSFLAKLCPRLLRPFAQRVYYGVGWRWRGWRVRRLTRE